MAKLSNTMTVDGFLWKREFLDDGSGWWFESKGAFGELIVEEERDGSFAAFWWPPKINVGEPVHIKTGSKTLRAAMRSAGAYIRSLSQALASHQAEEAP